MATCTTHPAIIIFPMAIHRFLIASYLSPPLDTSLSQILLQVIRPNYINIFTALALSIALYPMLMNLNYPLPIFHDSC